MSSLSDKLLARHGSSASAEPTPEPEPASARAAASAAASPRASPAPPATLNLPRLAKVDRNTPSPVPAVKKQWLKAPAEASAKLNLDPVDKRLLAATVQAVQKNFKVKIESSSSAGATTLLLRGPDAQTVEAAGRELRSKLSPRVSRTVQIAAEGRSAVLGKGGAQIKQLQSAHDVRINVGDVGLSEGEWASKTCSVVVAGGSHGVAQAVSEILELTSAAPVRSSREIEPRLAPFVERLGVGRVATDAQGASVYLNGSPAEVDAAQRAVDELIAASADFVTSEVQVPAVVDTAAITSEFGVSYTQDTVFGPPDAVPKAAKRLRELAKATVTVDLDISRAHDKSEQHAVLVAQYLDHTATIARVSESSGAAIVRDGVVYRISAGDAAAASAAKKQLVDEVNKLTPQRVRRLPALKSLQAQKLAQAQTKPIAALYVALVDVAAAPTLIYLGNDEDFAPSDAEVQSTLDEAAALLGEAQHADANNFEKKVPVAPADLKFVREPLGEAATEYRALAKPVHVVVNTKSVTLSGLRADVEALAKALPGIVAASKDYQSRSSYTETLQFDQKHIRNLIGRSGSNIGKLRDEHSVRIDVQENGTIALKGLEQNVRAARKAIEDTEKRLQDETTQTLQVAQKHHSVLIGNKGKFVRRIKDKYNVYVQFPKPGAEDNDQIVLVGPTRGVASAIKEFKDLVEYEESHGFEKVLEVPAHTVNRIIGRGGQNISSIKQATETQIEISREPVDAKIAIKIVGEKKKVAEAAAAIQSAVDELLDATERSIEVDSKYHRHIVGPNNETRRRIVETAGGVVEPWNPRTLQVPSSTSSSTTVKISGPSKVVESIEAQIKALVAKLESAERCSVSFEIPSDEFSAVLGHGGSRKRAVEEAHGVAVNITRAGKVTVKGPSDAALEAARAEILSLVSAGRAAVEVPAPFASELFNRGMLARQLSDEFGVQLQVGKGQFNKDRAVPPAPELTGTSAVVYESLGESASGSGSSTPLTWTLASKSQAQADAAAASLKESLARIERYDSVAFLWLAKPTFYSSVIGPMGSTINALRQKTGCGIFVPKNARKQLQPIEVVGERAAVEAAVQAILSEVSA